MAQPDTALPVPALPATALPATALPATALPAAAPHRSARSGQRARAGLVVGLAAASTLAFLPGTGLADPPPSVAQVQAQVDALDLQVEQAGEAFNQAQIQLDALTAAAQAAQADVERQTQLVRQKQAAVSDVIASAYKTGGAANGFQLLATSSSPQAYLDRISSLDQLTGEQARRLAAVQAARAQLVSAQQKAAADLTAQQAAAKAAGDHKAEVEKALADSNQLLGSLQEQQRQQLAAAEAASEAQQAAQSAQAMQMAGPTYTGPATGAAAAAVAAAYSRLGKPYVWGASGPDTFDCSGLTMWAWAHAGVSLPHFAAAQYAMGQKVSTADIQPGDLVFFGSDLHHVGIYIGGGNMISAPHTGDVVKIQPAFRSDFVGASRP